MEKRDTIRALAHKLKLAGVDKETGVTLSLMARRPGGAEQLMTWMEQNPEAPLEKLYDKAREIHKTTHNNQKKTDVLWDRLSGGLAEYIQNYLLKKYGGGKFRIQPSYDVDYEIADAESLFDDMSFEGFWVHKVAACRNINDLEPRLQRLVLQFLPRFFEQFPEYRFDESLKIKDYRD